MTASAAASIYNMIIMAPLLYCRLLKPTLTQTQVNIILLFERRVKEVTGYKQRRKKQINLVNIRKQRICSFVHKVVMGEVGDPFENYFEFLNTTFNTRNKNILLPLPKLKLEYGRRSTKYHRAKIFNDLPIEVCRHCKENNFNSILKNYFLSEIYFDTAYIALCSCVYLSIYVSVLPSILQSLAFTGHGVVGTTCPRNNLLIPPCIFISSIFLRRDVPLFLFT